MRFARLSPALFGLALMVNACATTPTPPPAPAAPPQAPPEAAPVEAPCPLAAEDPGQSYALGRELIESSREGKYHGGLTYQTGLDKLLEAARGGHRDAQYLHGYRRYVDAYGQRPPSEREEKDRALYVESLSSLALAAEQGQLDAIAFFPSAVLQALLAPATPYVAYEELEGTTVEELPPSWIEAARRAVLEARRCLPAPEMPSPSASLRGLPQTPDGYALIGAGSFVMGDMAPSRGDELAYLGDPAHRVTLTRPFLIQKTEVTRGQWKAIMRRLPKGQPPCEGTLCPVSQVSWLQAVKYVNALSVKEGLERCYSLRGGKARFEGLDCLGYRLPTEAEWEYAARAGQGGLRYGLVEDVAWVGRDPASGAGPRKVASLGANDWALHDMLGNVAEWCHDWHEHYDAAQVTDPVGPSFGAKRVLRGGSYGQGRADATFSARARDEAKRGAPERGFRPVRTVVLP